MTEVHRETDSLGVVEVPADKLWGADALAGALQHRQDLIPREMITAYAILKKAAANANHAGGRLDERAHRLIAQAVRPRRRSGEDGQALCCPGYKQVKAATCI
jgi:fumarate hydratase, class II